MTAEIALLNRRALAFAADSAVTISDGVSEKIYNSAEKIFELSRRVPLGLMLFNNMEFVGVPLDVITRKFRAECDADFPTCKAACSAFLEFLRSFRRSKDDEIAHFRAILAPEIQEIARTHREQTQIRIREEIRKDNFDIDRIAKAVFLEIVREHADIHIARPLDGFLAEVTPKQFVEAYGDAVVEQFSRKFPKWKDDVEVSELIIEWALAALRSNVFSENLTGLVFGGFGTEDLFPSLYSIEIDGIFFDQIKCKVTHDVDIDRRGEKAAIIPFAQSEMVERFLFGIDSDLESTLLKFIQRSSDKVLAKLQTIVEEDLSGMGIDGASYSSNVESLLDRLKSRSRAETLDMVDFMPKQELAYAAESFVSLTSVKRKVSSQQETVGGPIDVAVITRNEGFIWIKRKHYFDAELNPGYRVRVFETKAEGGNDKSKAKTGRTRGAKPVPRNREAG